MRTSAYKRPQGKGSPAVSYYPKGMLVRGGGKGRDGGVARARGGGGGGARSALKSRGRRLCLRPLAYSIFISSVFKITDAAVLTSSKGSRPLATMR